MSVATIEIKQKTMENFSVSKLEKFVNSEDFENLVLGYQMIKGETWVRKNYSSFKKELWL